MATPYKMAPMVIFINRDNDAYFDLKNGKQVNSTSIPNKPACTHLSKYTTVKIGAEGISAAGITSNMKMKINQARAGRKEIIFGFTNFLYKYKKNRLPKGSPLFHP